jgi:hypothetical protein
MATYQISCTVDSTDITAKLGLEIWFDDQQLWSTEYVSKLTTLTFDLDEDETEHELKFIMKNKKSEHTQIDETGNIVSDARLIVSNLAFDEIELKQIFIDQAIYTHNFNGTQPEVADQFYGEMGCNGTVSLKFSTPIYLWLLEHM